MGKSTISMAIFNCYVSSPEGMFFPWNFIVSRDRMGNSTGSSQGFCGVFLPLQMLENVDGGFFQWSEMQFFMHHEATWCNMMHDDDFMTMKRISAGWNLWLESLLLKNSGPQVWNKSLRNYDHFGIQKNRLLRFLYDLCARSIGFFFGCHGLHFRMVSGARQPPDFGSLRCRWSKGRTSEAQQMNSLWSKVADGRTVGWWKP